MTDYSLFARNQSVFGQTHDWRIDPVTNKCADFGSTGLERLKQYRVKKCLSLSCQITHQNLPKLPENAYFGLFRSSPSTDFVIIGFIVSAHPIYVEIGWNLLEPFQQIDFKALLTHKNLKFMNFPS